MRQKYRILRNDEKNELIIREYAELDKETLSFLCEERFKREDVEAAIVKGGGALISALRTQNMYPPSLYAKKIAEMVMEIYSADGPEKREGGDKHMTEVFFDDVEFLKIPSDEPEIAEETEEKAADDIDNLLEEDEMEGNLDDKNAIKNIKSSVKIADEESLNAEGNT
ncbi:MAG: hypothetical protein B6245_00975 [Desulfobacteraceae bacterium 4572_88]|nr:MAG: hypothetical protein B6245_00975 [Desulfobacteraceae bacterium 4572_88]